MKPLVKTTKEGFEKFLTDHPTMLDDEIIQTIEPVTMIVMDMTRYDRVKELRQCIVAEWRKMPNEEADEFYIEDDGYGTDIDDFINELDDLGVN